MIVDIGSADDGWSGYTLGIDELRKGARLLQGDTDLGDMICRSTNYANGQYLRMVISFFNEDNVSPQKAELITNEFLDLFMHGFKEEEYHKDIVEHTDTSNLHHHVRIPKLNLLTGTQLKLYWHKSDLDRKVAIIDYLVEKHGLTHALERKTLTPSPQKKVKQINQWRSDHKQDPFILSDKKGRGIAEEQITDYINTMNIEGMIDSLDDVQAELIAMGFKIAKIDHDIGKDFDYITVQNDTGKIRLKGDIYGERFYEHKREDRAKAISDNRSLDGGRKGARQSPEELLKRVEKENAKRFKWVDGRYKSARQRAIQRAEQRAKAIEAELHSEPKETLDNSSPHRPDTRDSDRNDVISSNQTADGNVATVGEFRGKGRTERNEVDRSHPDSKPKGEIRNDRIRAEVTGRTGQRKERKKERVRAVEDYDHRTSQLTYSRVPRVDERTLREREQRRQERKRIIGEYNNPTIEDYNAIERATKERTDRREVIKDFNSSVQILRNSIDVLFSRVKRELNNRVKEVANTIKGLSMEELNKFKTNINLAEFSTTFGYYKDKEKSSTNAPVMKHENGDKIIIGKDRSDGHYVYFNPNNDRDNGTVIDFVKARTNETLGHIRKRLRRWLHNPQPQENITVKASTKDARRIYAEWDKIESNTVILNKFQGIKSNLLEKLVSGHKAKMKGNTLYFALNDINGLCGIEKRTSDGTKHIFEGSTKGVFVDGKLDEAERILIFESPLDMLAYRQLGNGRINDYSVCTMGSIGESAEKSLQAILDRNKDAELVLAVDNDDGGKKIVAKIATIVPTDRNISMELPQHKDWKDELHAKQEKQSQTTNIGMSR